MAARSRSLQRREVLRGASALSAGIVGGALLGCRKGASAMSSITTGLQPVAHILAPREKHWVGDGFHVSTIFSPFHLDPQVLSPFIMLDHAAPRHFDPSDRPKGVGEHPHRGFETVTFALQGEVAHRDSNGGGGTIGPGDAQWMTAARGVVHEELFSKKFTKQGGMFEMMQLWVNLPAAKKMGEPRYQELTAKSFPTFKVGSAEARLIAGGFLDHEGPGMTHSPITVFDLDFYEDGASEFHLTPGTTTLFFLARGEVRLGADRVLRAGEMAVMNREQAGAILAEGKRGSRALILNGQPLNEPVVAYGPFVMNTEEEIIQAAHDYRSGKMGHLPAQ